jgi:hypothetical protein
MSNERTIPVGVPLSSEAEDPPGADEPAPVELSSESLERVPTDRRTGPRRGGALTAHGIPWEPIGPDPHAGNTIFRARAPGGWIVAFPPAASGNGQAFYVPDPDGEW